MDFLLSVLTGGATGLIGSILTKGIGLFESHQKRKEKALDYAHELTLLDKQAAIKQAETESAARIAEANAAANLRAASYGHDTGSGRASRWVVDVLRLVRPALTLILIILVGIIYGTTVDFGALAEIQAAVIYMASSAVLWWFGDRAMTQRK